VSRVRPSFGSNLGFVTPLPTQVSVQAKDANLGHQAPGHYAFREMGVVEIESEWTGRDRELKVTGGQPRVFLCPS